MLTQVQDHEKAINIFLLHTLNLSFPVVVFDDHSFGVCLTKKPFLIFHFLLGLNWESLCTFQASEVNVWVQYRVCWEECQYLRDMVKFL